MRFAIAILITAASLSCAMAQGRVGVPAIGPAGRILAGAHPAIVGGAADRHSRTGRGNGWSPGTAFGGYGYPMDYGIENSYAQGTQGTPVLLVMPPAIPEAPAPPSPPPPPAHPVIREYNWPPDGQSSAASFTIVQRDGTVRLAISVWVQEGALNFTAADGRPGKLPLKSVDPAATARINAEKGLTWRISDQ